MRGNRTRGGGRKINKGKETIGVREGNEVKEERKQMEERERKQGK